MDCDRGCGFLHRSHCGLDVVVVSAAKLVTISSTQTVLVADEGAIMANVVGDEVYIYPQGLGRGPMIVMPKSVWGRIQREVALAFARSEAKSGSLDAQAFIAREGLIDRSD